MSFRSLGTRSRLKILSSPDSNLESVELGMEIDKDALAQLDGLLEWMDSRIKGMKKVCPWLLHIGFQIVRIQLLPRRLVSAWSFL